jgi:hypothetical protein
MRHVLQKPILQAERIRDGPILAGRMARGDGEAKAWALP